MNYLEVVPNSSSMAMKCHSCLREISLNHFSLLNELKFGK